MSSEFLTPETWEQYLEDGANNEALLHGYLDAVTHIAPIVKNILDTAKDFDDLKTQLTTFYNKQVLLQEDLYNRWQPS
jgi:hypothetical protein